jgi:hypothetical protein
MYTRLIVLLVAGTALSGCCMSGTGCSGPTAAGGPIAWDGLGEAPTANDEPGEQKRPKRRTAARNREIILGPLNDASPKDATSRDSLPKSDAKAQYDAWTRLPNEDPEADAKLARQLKICRNC